MKLTKSAIDKLKYGKSSQNPKILFDDLVPGFAVRVYPSGSKSFLIDYRLGGRQRRMVIGRYGVLTLDQARKTAKKRLAEVLGGKDPLDQKRKSDSGETVRVLCSLFLEGYAKQHKKSWGEDERRINKHIIPAIGKIRIGTLKRADIIALHNKLGEDHPYEANRVLALLSVMFEYARKTGHLPEAHANPARDIAKFKEKKRDRWLRPEELPRLMEAIEACPNLYIRAALMLYLLTGVRKNELLRAQWDHVDFERAELCLPDTKSGRTHYVPLSGPALDILKSLPREERNPHILPGRIHGKHLVNISKPWKAIRQAAGLEDVRLHDLRRTVGSWLATSGVSLQVIGRILNHADISTTERVYAHLSQDPLRTAMEQHGKKLIEFSKLRKKADPRKEQAS